MQNTFILTSELFLIFNSSNTVQTLFKCMVFLTVSHWEKSINKLSLSSLYWCRGSFSFSKAGTGVQSKKRSDQSWMAPALAMKAGPSELLVAPGMLSWATCSPWSAGSGYSQMSEYRTSGPTYYGLHHRDRPKTLWSMSFYITICKM